MRNRWKCEYTAHQVTNCKFKLQDIKQGGRMKSSARAGRHVAGIMLAATWSCLAHAGEIANRTQDPSSGVVLNQTVTVGGQDFFRHFSGAWRDSPLSERVIVIVREQPSARLGNIVWIEYSQKKVFQANLPPSREHIRKLGNEAASVVQEAIVSAEVEQATLVDSDLAKEEI
jgi:curli production assembly/transport component CsgE